jgi:hypothetical protein
MGISCDQYPHNSSSRSQPTGVSCTQAAAFPADRLHHVGDRRPDRCTRVGSLWCGDMECFQPAAFYVFSCRCRLRIADFFQRGIGAGIVVSAAGTGAAPLHYGRRRSRSRGRKGASTVRQLRLAARLSRPVLPTLRQTALRPAGRDAKAAD